MLSEAIDKRELENAINAMYPIRVIVEGVTTLGSRLAPEHRHIIVRVSKFGRPIKQVFVTMATGDVTIETLADSVYMGLGIYDE